MPPELCRPSLNGCTFLSGSSGGLKLIALLHPSSVSAHSFCPLNLSKVIWHDWLGQFGLQLQLRLKPGTCTEAGRSVMHCAKRMGLASFLCHLCSAVH
jgi:hypothetical protein